MKHLTQQMEYITLWVKNSVGSVVMNCCSSTTICYLIPELQNIIEPLTWKRIFFSVILQMEKEQLTKSWLTVSCFPTSICWKLFNKFTYLLLSFVWYFLLYKAFCISSVFFYFNVMFESVQTQLLNQIQDFCLFSHNGLIFYFCCCFIINKKTRKFHLLYSL